MGIVRFQRVTKIFRHRPGLAGLFGNERGGETLALKEIDLDIAEGEIVALLGPNGSGKTTLLKLVSTMLLPDEGSVTVAGSDTGTQADQVKKAVGIAVANERSFYPRLTAIENLDFFGTLENIAKAERKSRIATLLEQVGLQDGANTLVMKFSSGMYQRLGVARALLKQPRVLLLDEPTRSLDPEGTSRLWEIMKATSERGTTVIVASHDFEEAALADRFCILDGGALKHCADTRNHSLQAIRSAYFDAVGESEGIRA